MFWLVDGMLIIQSESLYCVVISAHIENGYQCRKWSYVPDLRTHHVHKNHEFGNNINFKAYVIWFFIVFCFGCQEDKLILILLHYNLFWYWDTCMILCWCIVLKGLCIISRVKTTPNICVNNKVLLNRKWFSRYLICTGFVLWCQTH